MRQKTVVRRRRANDDIESAISCYLEEAGVEIATDFVDRFEEAVQKISKNAAAGSQRFGHEMRIDGLRQWPVNHFLYLIFYVEKERHIEIARILHTSLDIFSRLDPDDAE